MGIFDSWSDLVAAATPWSTAEAEAAPEPEHKDDDEDAEESAPDGDDDGKKGDDKEEEPEEEEEEEEDMVDPKETFEEECRESKTCAPFKHHFEECVERVTGADDGKPVDKKHPNEDCVEEFFHLAHCATQCAAPKLWSVLK